jgi:hypothetical protein
VTGFPYETRFLSVFSVPSLQISREGTLSFQIDYNYQRFCF